MAFSKMPTMPKGKTPMGKMAQKGKAMTSKPAPKQTYKERLAKPEPDNFMKKPPKVGAPAVNKARAKRLRGVAL